MMNTRDLTKAFNAKFGLKKSEVGIKTFLTKHKIYCGRKPGERLITRRRLFSEEQEIFIRENYRKHNIDELMDLFNERFNTSFEKSRIKSFIFRNKIQSGRTGRFPKGLRPWNTNTKGLTTANSGSFKKGHVPPNRKPIGSERICSKDGYILIKINERDPYTGFPTRYKLKHVYLWEKANGSIPKGFVIIFKDGNKKNCVLDNLMMISRALLLQLNQKGYRGAPGELKPSILALSKLQIGISSAKKRDFGDH